jgi:hypothetical protein
LPCFDQLKAVSGLSTLFVEWKSASAVAKASVRSQIQSTQATGSMASARVMGSTALMLLAVFALAVEGQTKSFPVMFKDFMEAKNGKAKIASERSYGYEQSELQGEPPCLSSQAISSFDIPTCPV